jgi:hypothetical protein
MQVITPENFQQFVETGKVPEFKPQEANKPAEATAEAASPAGDKSTATPARDETGKFTKADDAAKSTPAASAKPAEPDDEGGDDLPEHVRKVIGKKHRLQKEAEEFARDQWRERQAAETRAEKLQRELEEEKAKSRPATPKATEPKADDFATVAEYSRALAKFWAAEELQAERDKAEQQRQADEKADRERTFGQRLAAAKVKYPDFEDALKSVAGTDAERVPLDVIEYMQESEHGADLLYHLIKHPETLERFRKLSPRRCLAELGKLETTFEKQAETPTASLSQAAATPATTPAVSKAPAPIAPLDSAKSTVVHKDPQTMTFQELREFERKREAEKRARR